MGVGGRGVNDKYQIKMNDYVQRTSTRKSCGHQPLSPKRLTTEEQERLRNTETEKKKKEDTCFSDIQDGDC